MTLGVGAGVGIFVSGRCAGARRRRHCAVSQKRWLNIDPHVLLFSFLPLLLFGDAMTLNVHHLGQKIWQCLILALPGTFVLPSLGTLLLRPTVTLSW